MWFSGKIRTSCTDEERELAADAHSSINRDICMSLDEYGKLCEGDFGFWAEVSMMVIAEWLL